MAEDTENKPIANTDTPIDQPVASFTPPPALEPQKRSMPKLPQLLQVPQLERSRTLTGAFLVLLCAITGFGGGWLGASTRADQPGSTNISQSREVVAQEGEVVSQIAKDVGESVVSVNVTSQSAGGFFNQSLSEESAGTGLIISTDGVIITNRHVVPAGASAVSVTLSDGTELKDVEVIGRTTESDPLDVAFLRVKDKKGKTLKAAKLGDSTKVKVGDKVVAIGNALGQFQNTVTSGIISGFGRSVEAGDASGGSSETLQNLFQTDAAINQGNSGGPLVNLSGEVIGMNTAIAGGTAQNIGFAIPLNDVQGLIKSVLAKGKLERPYLGVRYVTLTDDAAFQLNLETKRGAYVTTGRSGESPIIAGSPAEKAGLKEKDIITKVDGTAIDETHSLTSQIGKHSVGDEVTLTIVRDGKEQTMKLKLEAVPTQ